MPEQPERIRVLYPDGRFAYTITPTEWRRMRWIGEAVMFDSTKKIIRAVQLTSGPSRFRAGTYYSHKSETADNPKNVWALARSSKLRESRA
jgi:hypothetical protein